MIQGITHYACYYGTGRLEALSQYDLVILQPLHYTSTQIAALREAGVTAIAYLAVGEAPEAKTPTEWAFYDPLTGRPVRNETWQTLYLDCRSAAWCAEVLERRVPWIAKQGFAGVLLDTLDVQERYPQTRAAMILLIREIRARFPQLALIPNRGFSITPNIADVSDALLFEAFSTCYRGAGYAAWDEGGGAWTAQQRQELRKILGTRPVLALDYAAPEDVALRAWAQQRATEHDCLSFVSTFTLDWLPGT